MRGEWWGDLVSWRKNKYTLSTTAPVSFNKVRLPDPWNCSHNIIAQKFALLCCLSTSTKKRKPHEAQYSARGFHYAEWWNRNGTSAVCCLLMHRWITDKGGEKDFNQTRMFLNKRRTLEFFVASKECATILVFQITPPFFVILVCVCTALERQSPNQHLGFN